MRASSLFVLLLAVVGCSGVQANDPVVAQQLQKMLVGFGAAFASKNMSLAGSYFLDTGVFLSDGYQPVVGRPAIEAALGALQDGGALGLELQVISASLVNYQPTLAWCEATYVKHGASGVLDTGFSTFVFTATGYSSWGVGIISSVSNVSDAAFAPSAARVARQPPVAGVQDALAAAPLATAANQDPMQYTQSFFDSFQQVFNAGGSMTASLTKLLSPSITIYTTGYNPIRNTTAALDFLTAGLAAKGYKLVSVLVVESGVYTSGLTVYARGIMTFYDINGVLLSGNNFLALLDGTAGSPTPRLLAFSVSGNGVGFVGNSVM